jgi:hypothetical protein
MTSKSDCKGISWVFLSPSNSHVLSYCSDLQGRDGLSRSPLDDVGSTPSFNLINLNGTSATGTRNWRRAPRGRKRSARGLRKQDSIICLCRASPRLMASTDSVFNHEILNKSPAYATLVVGYIETFWHLSCQKYNFKSKEIRETTGPPLMPPQGKVQYSG